MPLLHLSMSGQGPGLSPISTFVDYTIDSYGYLELVPAQPLPKCLNLSGTLYQVLSPGSHGSYLYPPVYGPTSGTVDITGPLSDSYLNDYQTYFPSFYVNETITGSGVISTYPMSWRFYNFTGIVDVASYCTFVNCELQTTMYHNSCNYYNTRIIKGYYYYCTAIYSKLEAAAYMYNSHLIHCFIDYMSYHNSCYYFNCTSPLHLTPHDSHPVRSINITSNYEAIEPINSPGINSSTYIPEPYFYDVFTDYSILPQALFISTPLTWGCSYPFYPLSPPTTWGLLGG